MQLSVWRYGHSASQTAAAAERASNTGARRTTFQRKRIIIGREEFSKWRRISRLRSFLNSIASLRFPLLPHRLRSLAFLCRYMPEQTRPRCPHCFGRCRHTERLHRCRTGIYCLRLYGYPQRDRQPCRAGTAAVSVRALLRCALSVLWTKTGQNQGAVLGRGRFCSAI